MKRGFRILSALICAVMLISAFAVIRAGAEETSTEQASKKNVLWSIDFENYTAGEDATAYLKANGINANTFNGTIADGKLNTTKNQWWHDGEADDDFRDLFYGLYTDENGNAVTDYHMDISYTLTACNETKSYTFKGTDENGAQVTYVIYTPYRGESYFNPLAGGDGFNKWLFKVGPTGYLYTAGHTSTQTFSTADGANGNIGYFTYTRKVGSTTSTRQTVTQEAWELMQAECGKEISSGTSFDRMHTGTDSYQLSIGTEYTIKVHMSVSANKTVTATTYIRPASSNEPFTKVGSVSYQAASDKTGKLSQAIRITENHSTYSFGNITFIGRGLCEGEHEFPTVISSGYDENGFFTYDKVRCLKCGAEYYTNCSTQEELVSYDFATMTASGYQAYTNSQTYNSMTQISFVEGKGLDFSFIGNSDQAGSEMLFNLPTGASSTKTKISFTTTISRLPVDQTGNVGSSFLTDRTGNAFNILLRMGRNAGYDSTSTTNEGWLKIRGRDFSADWKKLPVAYTIKEGETYEFTVILNPAEKLFDLYINDEFIGTGGLHTDKWVSGAKNYFRLANMMCIGMTLKSLNIARVYDENDYVLTNGFDGNFEFSVASRALEFKNDSTLGAFAKNTVNGLSSTALMITDTDLALKNTPYNISFDLMMTDGGSFRDDLSTDPALWSLISWINTDKDTGDKYGTLVRVGALDNDDTKEGFERFFLVMNSNYAYSDTNDNGNQGYTTTNGGNIAGYYSDKKSVFSFEAGEWITITLSYDPLNNSAYLFANGELVASAVTNALSTKQIADNITASKLRLGDAFRKLHYNWAIKDIELTLTPSAPLSVKDSGELVNFDFGGTYTVGSTFRPSIGSTTHTQVAAKEVYKDTASQQGYARFLATAGSYAAGATNLFNLSLTSKTGTDLYLNHLDGAKYSIESTFAFFDRVPTADEQADLEEYNTTNNKSHALPSTLSYKEVTVMRLSKYNDANRVILLVHDNSSLKANTTGGVVRLYTRDESGELVKVNAWYTESQMVDGRVPESAWVKANVVVDESNDTFSVYVNDKVAYYLDGSVYKRAENLKFKLETTANSFITKYPNAPETVEWLKNPTYASIPRSATVDGTVKTYGSSGLSIVSYVRFFQNCLDFSVRDLKITKVDDGLNFVGTQIRAGAVDPSAFDLRFVFATDDIYVDSIEYDVKVSVNGTDKDNTETAVSETVYKSIKAGKDTVSTWKIEEGDFFSVFNVDGIELGDNNTEYTFRITPYASKYNATTGEVERDDENASVTHVVTVNGFGEMIGYTTEKTEYSDIKSVYTKIADVPYKALGRTQVVGEALTADWSGAGIEFSAICLGEVSIQLAAASSRKFTVVIDGKEYKDVTLSSGKNVIASGLEYGPHSFKIMNQAGYSGKIDIEGVTIRGSFGEKPADGALLIEFIGDSITHGCGLGNPTYSDGTNDGTLTYAFIAAKELGADYTIMANGGMGVKWGGDYDSTNLNRSMAKYPYLNDKERGSALYEGYTKAADIVVIGLSTNDNFRFQTMYNSEKAAFKAANPSADAATVDAHMTEFTNSKMAELGAELELLIKEIEKNHGKNVSIVLARGMMERTLANDYPTATTPEAIASAQAAIDLYHTSVTYMTSLIENEWGGKYGDHIIKVAHLTPDRTGHEGHPKREGAAIQGKELAEFIKTNFPELVAGN